MSETPASTRSASRTFLEVLVRLGGFTVLFLAVMIGVVVAVGGTDNLLIQGAVMCLAALVATVVLLRLDGRRTLAEVGMHGRGAARRLGRGFGFGLAIVVPALALALVGGLRYGPDRGTAIEYLATGAWTGLVLLLPAAAEEFVFRGYPFQVMAERWGTAAALVLTTVLFSVAHGWNPNVGVVALLNIALAGLLLGTVRIVTGSLWSAIGVHTGWNLATGFVADLPVSGLTLVDAPLIEVTATGHSVLTGGEFGLEGGLGTTLAVCLAIAFVARGWRVRPGTAPAEPAGAVDIAGSPAAADEETA